MDVFKNISFRGRVAYGISCFESALIALKYNLDEWKFIVNYLWEFTSIQYLDEWSDTVVELIPENLLEFKTFEEEEFERLSKDEFIYLYNLYQTNDGSIDILLRAIYELGISRAYTVIEGYGESSLKSLEKIIDFMIENKFPLPNIDPFLGFSIEENSGWGNKFDGISLSNIL
ncbi:hypothetical protein [Lysinibacillus odysseyi]|uniref:hypothetical protein n=1 Tax=Lysinibacillus odysseyi TaxID=202611 RepID=UPI000AADF86C